MTSLTQRFSSFLIGAAGLALSAQIAASNLGVTPCSEVLKSPSNVWIQRYTQENGQNALEQVKAILRYEYCYAQHLDQLHDQINQSKHFPMMGAMSHFRDMENALKEFNHIAIRPCGQTGDRVRIQRAYSYLYQLQFRAYFLADYQAKNKTAEDDAARLVKAKATVHALMAKETPEDAVLIQNRFEKLRQLAVEQNHVPEFRVYEYAAMMLSKSGPIALGEPPF